MYSQNKEERIILDYFGEEWGTFLSIGENDGKTLSNVRALFESGWDGVCIEPDPKAFQKLKSLYAGIDGVSVHNVAISDKTGKATFYSSGTHLNKKDTGLLSSLKETETKRWKVEKFEEIEVNTIRWDEFYSSIPQKTFQFISVDTEGYDYEILSQMDLNAMDTRMICVEWNGVEERRKMFDSLLTGWKMIHLNGENLIYVKL